MLTSLQHLVDVAELCADVFETTNLHKWRGQLSREHLYVTAAKHRAEQPHQYRGREPCVFRIVPVGQGAEPAPVGRPIDPNNSAAPSVRLQLSANRHLRLCRVNELRVVTVNKEKNAALCRLFQDRQRQSTICNDTSKTKEIPTERYDSLLTSS